MKHLKQFIFNLTLFLITIINCENLNNIDTKFVILFKSEKNSLKSRENELSFGTYFGLTLSVIKTDNNVLNIVLIGAPRDQQSNSNRSGCLYRCVVGNNERTLNNNNNQSIVNCNEIDFNSEIKTNNMFLGGSVLSNGTHFISCAHIWSYKRTDDYNPIGKCYAININGEVVSTFTFNSLSPRLITAKRDNLLGIAEDGRPFYSTSMAGFSLASLSDQSVIFGAPGVVDFMGTIIKQTQFRALETMKLYENLRNKFDIDYLPRLNSYFGYSLTTGHFIDREEYIVVGAPRNNYFNGTVYLFRANKRLESIRVSDRNSIVIESDSKTAEGEYFGSTLLAIDLNNDQLSDLIIGAPLYSVENQREIGRIYVYITSQDSIRFSEAIDGKKYGSRFGSSLSSIDVNLDNYQDAIIGAPYETNSDHSSTGAIYIYYGSANGLQTHSFLRIGSENIELNSIKLKGFGISIVSNIDFDNNGYNDILIGSYISQHTTLLRVKPLAKFEMKVNFIPSKVKLGETNCLNNQKTCFNVTYCVNFVGKHLSDLQSADITLTVSDRRLRAKEVRATINTNSNTKTVKLKANQIQCFTTNEMSFPIAFTGADNVLDISTPIEFRLTATLNNNQNKNTFCKNCAIAQTYSNYYEIEFEHGCNKKKCVADLQLFVETKYDNNVIENEEKSILIEGLKETIDVNITVENKGNASLNTMLIIRTLLQLSESGDYRKCNKNLTNDQTIHYSCIVNRILDQNKKQTMILHFNINHVQTNRINFNFQITSDSDLIKPQSLSQLRNYEIRKNASLELIGEATNSNYSYTHKLKEVPFSVIYELVKRGPSTINSPLLHLLLPEAIIVLKEELNGICIKKRKANSNYNVIAVNNTINLECDNNAKQCSEYTCKLDKLNSGSDSVRVEIRAVLLPARVKHVSDYSTLQLYVLSLIEVEDKYKFKFETEISAHALTIVRFAHQKSTMDRHVELWILFVSAGSAVIFLLIITILLINYGFFRRKKREELIKVKQRYSMKPSEYQQQCNIEDLIDENENENDK